MSISATSIGKMINKLAEEKPELLYFYATECEPIKLERFFELYAKALGKKAVEISLLENLVKSALPKDLKGCFYYYDKFKYFQ